MEPNRKFNYEALIRKVKLYPAVFDSKHEMHKNRAYVNELWRQIAESLHCTDTLCREKWANLRSNYMRETRKLTIRRIEGKPLKVTWPYFSLLEFLNPSFHKKIANDMAMAAEAHDEERLVIDLKTENSQETDNDEQTEPNYRPDTIEPDNGGSVKRKKRTWRQTDKLSALDRDVIETLVQRVREASDLYAINEDKDRLFLLSLLPFMKQLNSRENLEFRMQVQQLIHNKLQSNGQSE